MKLKYIIGIILTIALIGVFSFIFDKRNMPSTDIKLTNTTNMTQTTGLGIVDEVIGNGKEAKTGELVTVDYVGYLTDGTVFDASKKHGNQGFSFTLGAGEVIKGWDVGVVGMKVGGKRKLTIPADMAYGNQAIGGIIPANSTLVFEIELLKVGE